MSSTKIDEILTTHEDVLCVRIIDSIENVIDNKTKKEQKPTPRSEKQFGIYLYNIKQSYTLKIIIYKKTYYVLPQLENFLVCVRYDLLIGSRSKSRQIIHMLLIILMLSQYWMGTRQKNNFGYGNDGLGDGEHNLQI